MNRGLTMRLMASLYFYGLGAAQVCATEDCSRQFQACCSNINFQTNLNA